MNHRTNRPELAGVTLRQIAAVLAVGLGTLVVALLAASYPATVAAVAVGAIGARGIPRVAAGVRTRLARRRTAVRTSDHAEAVGS